MLFCNYDFGGPNHNVAQKVTVLNHLNDLVWFCTFLLDLGHRHVVVGVENGVEGFDPVDADVDSRYRFTPLPESVAVPERTNPPV